MSAPWECSASAGSEGERDDDGDEANPREHARPRGGPGAGGRPGGGRPGRAGPGERDAVDLPETQPVLGVQGQVHYLPFDGPQFLDMLRGEHGFRATGTSSRPVRLITSMVSALDGNQIAVDHWEDGYDADPDRRAGAHHRALQPRRGRDRPCSNNLVDVAQPRPASTPAARTARTTTVATGSSPPAPSSSPPAAGRPAPATLHANAAVVPDVDALRLRVRLARGRGRTPYPGEPRQPLAVGVRRVRDRRRRGRHRRSPSTGGSTVTPRRRREPPGRRWRRHRRRRHGRQAGPRLPGDRRQAAAATSYEGRIFRPDAHRAVVRQLHDPGRRPGTPDRVSTTRVFLYNPSGSAITVDRHRPGGGVDEHLGAGPRAGQPPAAHDDGSAAFSSPRQPVLRPPGDHHARGGHRRPSASLQLGLRADAHELADADGRGRLRPRLGEA